MWSWKLMMVIHPLMLLCPTSILNPSTQVISILQSSLTGCSKAINASLDWYLQQWPFSLICTMFLWYNYCWQGPGLSEMLCWCGRAHFTWKCFLFVWTDIPWLKTTVATLGRLSITIAFEVVYLVNSELYPTTVRYVKSSLESFNFSLCFSPFPVSVL